MTQIKTASEDAFYRQIFAKHKDIIFIHDPAGIVFDINPVVSDILGYTPAELIGRQLYGVISPNDSHSVAFYLERIRNEGKATGTIRVKTRSGYEKMLSCSWSLLDGKSEYIWGTARDVTTEILTTKVLEETWERLERLVANLPGIVYRGLNDDYYTMFYLSDYLEKVLGYQAGHIVENKVVAFSQLIHEEDRQQLMEQINERLTKKQPYFVDYRLRHRLGHTIHVCEIGRGVFTADNQLSYREGVILDITDRKHAEEQLKRQHAELIQLHNRVHQLSITDALTGLFNRYYFEQMLEQYVDDPEAYPLSLILVDVDGLKIINDTLGHQRGDEMLQTVARALRAPFRSEDIVSRIGGDEFAIVLPRTDAEIVENARIRILKGLEQESCKLEELRLSVSLGVVTVATPSVSVAELVKKADDAMYNQKIAEASEARNGVVKSLVATLEVRDYMTVEHTERLQLLAESFGREASLTEREIDDLLLLTLLHDIGKIGIPDKVLFKPGPLSGEERCLMQKHSEIGYRIAASTPELTAIARYILLHHERWDGQGYPRRLQGRRIPTICRILTIIDAYDAMISDRPYRPGMTHEEAISELRRCAGTQFDPEMVELFINKVIEKLEKIKTG